MSSLFGKTWLIAGFAVVFGLALRILFLVATPIAGASFPGKLSSYNDEIAHANYTSYLLSHHALPEQIEPIDSPGALQRGSYENYQPPLYYLLHALISAMLPVQDAEAIVCSGRILSLLFGILLLPVFLLMARDLKLSSIEITAGIVFLSLSGVLIRFQTTCSNDSLFWLLIGLSYWTVLRLQQSDFSLRNWACFVLLVALALYTKLSALLLLPLPLLFILRQRTGKVLLQWGLSILAILLLTLPVWIRNLNSFGGLLPLQSGFGTPAWRLPDFSSILYSYRSLVFPWSEFWQGGTGLLLMSIPIILIVFLRYRNLSRQSRKSEFTVFIFGFVLSLLAFIWLNLRYDQAEARYLFAAWPALTLFVARSVYDAGHLWHVSGVLLLPYLLFLV